jgi:hypothetical protein
MSWEIAVLLALGALAWYWLGGMSAREKAVAAGRQACSAAGVQFLDDTVALVKTRPVRDSEGRIRLARLYRFEFSDTGDDRRPGLIRVEGDHAAWVDMSGHRVLHGL